MTPDDLEVIPAIPDPVECLLQLQEAAQSGAVSTDVANWFGQGIEAYLLQRGTLDQCLKLTGGGGIRKALTRHLTSKRNYHLRQAWSEIDGASPWRRSVALATQIQRFESILWPRWRDLTAAPVNCSRLRLHLFEAFRTGASVPVSLSQIHEICSPMSDRY